MTSLPHTQLLLGPSRSIVIAGPHIQVLDSRCEACGNNMDSAKLSARSNGDLAHSTINFTEEEKQAILRSGPVRCAAVDATFTHLVTAGDDKNMKIWLVEGLTLLSTRELPKKPTKITFASDGQSILVSDKFGDVFRCDSLCFLLGARRLIRAPLCLATHCTPDQSPQTRQSRAQAPPSAVHSHLTRTPPVANSSSAMSRFLPPSCSRLTRSI